MGVMNGSIYIHLPENDSAFVCTTQLGGMFGAPRRFPLKSDIASDIPSGEVREGAKAREELQPLRKQTPQGRKRENLQEPDAGLDESQC